MAKKPVQMQTPEPAKKSVKEAVKSAIETPPPVFTAQQAQALIDTARAAPCQNSDHADGVRTLLHSFARWFEYVNKPK